MNLGPSLSQILAIGATTVARRSRASSRLPLLDSHPRLGHVAPPHLWAIRWTLQFGLVYHRWQHVDVGGGGIGTESPSQKGVSVSAERWHCMSCMCLCMRSQQLWNIFTMLDSYCSVAKLNFTYRSNGYLYKIKRWLSLSLSSRINVNIGGKYACLEYEIRIIQKYMTLTSREGHLNRSCVYIYIWWNGVADEIYMRLKLAINNSFWNNGMGAFTKPGAISIAISNLPYTSCLSSRSVLILYIIIFFFQMFTFYVSERSQQHVWNFFSWHSFVFILQPMILSCSYGIAWSLFSSLFGNQKVEVSNTLGPGKCHIFIFPRSLYTYLMPYCSAHVLKTWSSHTR